MLHQSIFALVLAYTALAVLVFLCLVRLRSMVVLLRTEPERFHSAFPSWAASVFGLLAVVSLGLIVPLETIDALVGGNNNDNLLQSILTVLAFWFFREAVQGVAFEKPVRRPRWLLVPLLAAFSTPFFFITERGPTSSAFMSSHADQLANVVYNVIYMGVIAWIVVDMIWALRRRPAGIYFTFSLGLAIILLSTIDEIVYICVAHLAPGPISDVTYAAFYVLFFGGVVVVGSGWIRVLVVERDYVGQVRFRLQSLSLIRVLIRVRRLGQRVSVSARQSEPVESEPSRSPSKPRLRVYRYVSGESTQRSAFAVLAEERGIDVTLSLLGVDAEDVAYRLVVQIRNLVARYGTSLTAREESLVGRIEDQYPGFDPELVPV
ncbi:hypothetical protein HQQ80_06085 [Microbacteriaceae bacterium VKM Ac-2855]|nr:hypothetical protein [Microbacteriaceae bacterium VKM Ac-2855]